MCIPSNAVAAFVGFLLTCMFVSGGGSLRSMASGKRTQQAAPSIPRLLFRILLDGSMLITGFVS